LIDPYHLRSKQDSAAVPATPPARSPWSRGRRSALLALVAATSVAGVGIWRLNGWLGSRAVPGAATTTPVQTSAASTSVPPAPNPSTETSIVPKAGDVPPPPRTPPPPPPMTESEATSLLTRYSAAYAAFDLSQLRQLYPALPAEHAMTVQADQATTRSCAHTFSNIRVSGTVAQPRLEANALKLCAPKELQQEIRERQHHVFELRRKPDGSLMVVRHTR
jgi:hypothetical protein